MSCEAAARATEAVSAAAAVTTAAAVVADASAALAALSSTDAAAPGKYNEAAINERRTLGRTGPGGSSGANGAADDPTELPPAAHGVEAMPPNALDIVWLASGEAACSVQLTAAMCIGELKAHIFELVGVPVSEQRLFSAGEEFVLDDTSLVDRLLTLRPLQLLRCVIDPRNTNLGHFWHTSPLEPPPSGGFEKVRVLAKSLFGTVWLQRRRRPDLVEELVAVKEMPNEVVFQNDGRETNEWAVHLNRRNAPSAEDALTEIGIMSYLSKQRDVPVYILRMLDVCADARSTYLVSEFAEGGELVQLAMSEVRFPEVQLRTYTWQLLQAARYLHAHNIGHRDISLENVLLKNGAIRLMDFGMSALVRRPVTGEVLRYFRMVGKDPYRAPECYVPEGSETVVYAPHRLGARDELTMAISEQENWLCQVRLPPDVAPDSPCLAELWGYTLPPTDIFAIGVCLFNLAWHSLPWAHAVPSDRYFAFVYARGPAGIEALLSSWKKQLLSSPAMQLLAEILAPDPVSRPSPEECLTRPWFLPVTHAKIPVHPTTTGGSST